MKSLELFSGAGGLAKGLEMAGFEHLEFVEFNCDACQTLRENFDPSRVFEGDVQDYDFTTHDVVDIVAGGPPCQPSQHRWDIRILICLVLRSAYMLHSYPCNTGHKRQFQKIFLLMVEGEQECR